MLKPGYYGFPFDGPDTYEGEPTDTQAKVLARALAHWVAAYGDPDATVKDVVEEILGLNPLSTDPMTRDEAVSIAGVFGLDV